MSAPTSSPDAIDFTPAELEAFTQRVKAEMNYDFTEYAPSSLKRRLVMQLSRHGYTKLEQLLERALADTRFREQMILDITVNTTEMFRDPTFFAALEQDVLPELKEREGLNIWHAACSTGEEVLSLAILLRQHGLHDRAKVYATDINHVVLERAQSGRYPKRHLELFERNYRAVNPDYDLARHYTEEGNDIVFDPTLLQNVKFQLLDLVKTDSFFKFDLILIRNVMIYFNLELQNRVFALMHKSLFNQGILCLGSKESMILCDIADKFKPVNEKEKIYRKVKL